MATGIAAALLHSNASDPQAVDLQTSLREYGIETALQRVSGLDPQGDISRMVRANYLLHRLQPGC